MRTLLVWLLLGLAPVTGVRLVCIERPPSRPVDTAVESAQHCDAFCPRPAASDDRVQSNLADMECLFVADGTLLMVVAGIAILPSAPAVPAELRSAAIPVESHIGYLGPLFGPQTRPPRA